jgi:hypothetical protein
MRMRRRAAVVAAIGLLGGCGGDDAITIEVNEVNGSGITGVVELSPAGEYTRVSVARLAGGTITGARVMPYSSCPGLDDKYPITPPTGIVQVPFEYFRDSDAEGELAAALLRNGRYVACGST